MDYYGNASAPMATTPKGREWKSVRRDRIDYFPGTEVSFSRGKYSVIESVTNDNMVTTALMMRIGTGDMTPIVVVRFDHEEMQGYIAVPARPIEWIEGNYFSDIRSAIPVYERWCKR